jgi:Flp pilus assembly CpaE family ATPase
VREFADLHGLVIAGVIPFDPVMTTAEREGVAPLDYAPDSPFVAAIDEIAHRLVSDGA